MYDSLVLLIGIGMFLIREINLGEIVFVIFVVFKLDVNF